MNRSDDIFPQPGGTPDPYWQRAFDDALETPPPRVWEGVERQLDLDESDGILPLWQHRQGRQSMLFGRWAAGIAASLLLTALGWWAWHREDAIRPDVAIAVTPAPMHTKPGTLLAPAGPTVASAEATGVRPLPLPRLAASNIARRRVRLPQADRSGTLALNAPAPAGESIGAANHRDAFAATGTLAVTDKPVEQIGKVQEPEKLINSLSNLAGGVNSTLVFTETALPASMRMKEAQSAQSGMAGIQPFPMSRSLITRSMTQSVGTQSITVQSQFGQLPPGSSLLDSQLAERVSERSVTVISNESSERAARAGAPLATQQSALRPQGNAQEETNTAPAIAVRKKRHERVWVSAGVTASSFNPAVALRSAFSPAASSFQSAVPSNSANAAAAATLQSQLGRAIAFQAGIGLPLGKHWSIETGVGYLNGENQVQSPARIATPSLSTKSESTANLYADLISRLAVDQSNYNLGTSKTAYADLIANQAGNYASGQQQAVSNAYQFVQVPVQVGYELRPRRKFGLALLTGLVSNWFVKNTVAESVTVKSGGGVYRPVTLAGTAGMRLRYRPDANWSASMAGTFQQSLQSLTLTDVSLQATPQQVGLSFSVDRHF